MSTKPKTADSLRATRVLVQGVLGAEERELALGAITWVKGANGSGKSSILDAILKTITSGANLAEVARIDPETGERQDPRVMLMLEGHLGGRERRFLLERQSGKQQLREEVAGAWKSVPRPGEVVASLVDGVLANPVRFLQEKPEERVKLLLRALPVELDRAKVEGIVLGCGLTQSLTAAARSCDHALTELEMVRGAVYAARTAANRDATANQNAADRCREAAGVPPQEDAGAAADQAERTASAAAAEVESLASTSAQIEEAARQGARAEARRLSEAAEAMFNASSQRHRAEAEADIAAHRAEFERYVAERNAQAAGRIKAALEVLEHDRKAALARQDAVITEAHAGRQERDEMLQEKRAALAAAQQEAARLREVADQAQRAAGLHAQVKTFEAKAEELREASARMSAALEALDDYRRSLASDLPAGLELRDGQLYVDGIPFDQCNTATRIRVAVEVACLRSAGSPWRFVVVDGAEAFDSEHRQALAAELKRRGVQAILAQVDDGELRGEVA